MASFTDQTPQFNPYVQQLPVEAMVKVGMEKQQRYDEGVQKIQTSIDNVAGLDIAKDSDKQYLQSQLNQLGSRLKTVAAGDFSNYQLVNSVGGMATQIGKDENIQNAVGSTAWYRKERARIQKDIDDGISNPANLDNFDKQASKWINSDEVGEKFSATYKKYFDVDKFTKETFDAVKPDGYTMEQLYLTNADGSLRRDKNNQPIYSPVAVKLEQEGRFPAKVRETLNHIMSDPRVAQQLQISGEYNYKGYDATALGKKVIALKDQKHKTYVNSLAELNLKKSASKGGAAEIESYDSQIANLENNMSQSDEQYQSLFDNINKNPDAVRGYLYSDEIKNQYTSMYSYMKESRTTSENAGWRANFDMQKERNDLAMKNATLAYQYASLKQAKDLAYAGMANSLKIATMKGGKGKGIDSDGDGVVDTFPNDGATEKALETGDLNLVSNFEEQYKNSVLVAGQATDDLLFGTLFTDDKNQKMLSGLIAAGKSRPEAQKIMIDNLAKRAGEDKNAFRARWTVKAQNILSKNPENLTPGKQSLLNSANAAQQQYKNKRAVYDIVHADVQNDLLKDLKPITYEWGDTKMKLSPQDQYDIAMSNAGFSPFASDVIKEQSKVAQGRLNAKGITGTMVAKLSAKVGKVQLFDENALGFDPIGVNKLLNQGIRSVTSLNPFRDQGAFEKIPGGKAFLNLFDHVNDQKSVDLLRKQAEIVKKHTVLNPALTTPLLTGNAEADRSISHTLRTYIGEAGITGNESANFKGNADDMMTILANPEKGAISLDATKDEVTGKVTPVVKFTNEKGEYAGELTITLAQAEKFGKTPSSWWESETTKIAKQRMQVTGNGTTSISGEVESPYTYRTNDVLVDKNDFKNLNLPPNIDVKGNIGSQQVVGRDGRPYTSYFNYLYINNNGDDFVRALPVPQQTMDQGIQSFDAINNQMIQQLIAEHNSKKSKK